MKMIPRKCTHPLCDQVFMVSAADFLTKFHASYCKQDFEAKNAKGFNFDKDPRCKTAQEKKDKKCLDMVNSEKTEESGTVAGELQSNSRKEESSKDSEKELLKNSQREEKEAKESVQILPREKKFSESNVSAITDKENSTPKEKTNGEDETRKEQMSTNEITTTQTSQLSGQGSTRTDSGENHSEGSNHLSTVLNVEKENSIQSLNESSKLLLGFAKSLVKGKIDDFGEVIQKPVSHEIDAALKCVEGVRNIQKTKLDFLKFSRELQREME